jgi:hypothetical protein
MCGEGKKKHFQWPSSSFTVSTTGVYGLYWKIPPYTQGGEGNISQCHFGEKYENGNRKRGEMKKKKEKRERKRENKM